MTQESVAQPTTETSTAPSEHSAHNTRNLLGPILCWAVVFADIGTSVYYTPGILYETVQGMAGFFVFLTMFVFVLLAIKYAEVTHRFPQGGGVVTVSALGIHPWAGAVGGMFILVDYFLTAAISSVSGMQYLSFIVLPLGATIQLPVVGSVQLAILAITIVVLILLGILNWIGISESAKVSLIFAALAFFSDIAILVAVFTHISFTDFLSLFPRMFSSHALTVGSFLMGFAGAFLAFSGLESISQLSPVMRRPRKRVAGIALLLVVLTIGLTSPLLTMFSTLLLPDKIENPILRAQIISLLADQYGTNVLGIIVAISASSLLVFASNTAIIGTYHVFLALSRMGFLPNALLKRNKLRDTPHVSIIFATAVPVLVLLFTLGNIVVLGEMYAFGLLGAFTLTCLGLDIVRARDWRRFSKAPRSTTSLLMDSTDQVRLNGDGQQRRVASTHDLQLPGGSEHAPSVNTSELTDGFVHANPQEVRRPWFKVNFVLGVLTTLLVGIAWCINLFTKPHATAFGGGVTLIGLAIAYVNYRIVHTKAGRVPVPLVVTHVDEAMPNSVLAVLVEDSPSNNAVIDAAVENANTDKPLVFVFLASPRERDTAPRMLEIIDPYLDNQEAKDYFGKAESRAIKQKIPTRRYIYLEGDRNVLTPVWQVIHPRDTIVSAALNDEFHDINPDRIRFEKTTDGKVVHLLKRW